MKDVILASLIAFALAALIANNPMPPAKSPLGVGALLTTLCMAQRSQKTFIPKYKLPMTNVFITLAKKSLINTAPMAWTGRFTVD